MTEETAAAEDVATDGRSIARRRALLRLGLAAGAAYVAPTVLAIDRSAEAANGGGPSCAKNPRKC